MYAPYTADLRRATPDDEKTVAALWRRAWSSANGSWASQIDPLEIWQERVHNEFIAPKDVLLNLADGGEVSAFMVIDPLRGYVDQLFVEPAHQGHGIGGTLLDTACERMPHGWSLHVGRENVGAQRFYAQYGLSRGAISVDPRSGRERIAYRWNPHHEFKPD